MYECKIKTVVIDDEQYCIDNIVLALKAYPEFELVASAQNGHDAKRAILTHKPDLLFLDVEMPREDGLSLLQSLTTKINWPMQVIFCTAFEKYLLSALRAGAFDFILKPFSTADFDDVMLRFFMKRSLDPALNNEKTISNNDFLKKQFLFIQTTFGIERFECDKILYFEYDKICKVWEAYSVDNKRSVLKRGSTANDILMLNVDFVQANQYQILNCGYIAAISTDLKCSLLPPFEKCFCISRRYQKEIFNRIALL